MSLPCRAHIIHIPCDSRRIRNVARLAVELKEAGIAEVGVFPGVRPLDRGPLYSVGEWGCYQSHLACMRLASQVPAGDSVMILEDDAVLAVAPKQLGEFLHKVSDTRWDFLHLGYLSNTVFRRWDTELTSQNVIRVRGILFGLQCYVVRPEGLDARCSIIQNLANEMPSDGGGVGLDGALCEMASRDPSMVRLAPPKSMFRSLPGIRSSLRPRSIVTRGREFAGASIRNLFHRGKR